MPEPLELERQNLVLRNAVINGLASMLALRPADGSPIDRQFGKICGELQETLNATDRTAAPMAGNLQDLQWQLAGALKELELVKTSLRLAQEQLEEAKEHIHLAFHPEIGWAVTLERHAAEVRRREELEEFCQTAAGVLTHTLKELTPGEALSFQLTTLIRRLEHTLHSAPVGTATEGPEVSA